MRDEVYDRQLYESGDIARLLARYEATIRNVCLARLNGHADAEDVAQNVRARLLAEFRRKPAYPYSVPYAVVVYNVTRWTVKEYFQGLRIEEPLPSDWDPGTGDSADEVDWRLYLGQLTKELPERERQVAEARYLQLLEPDQIAKDYGLTRNNVDQALWRFHDRLRKEG